MSDLVNWTLEKSSNSTRTSPYPNCNVWSCGWDNRYFFFSKQTESLTLFSWFNDSQCPTVIRSQETAWWRLSHFTSNRTKILELEHLSQSFSQLRQARNKFLDCIKSINEGAKEEYEGWLPCPMTILLTAVGKSILVPLTSSLYVPGKLKNAGKVLVDVGTGYYIEKVCLLSWGY